MKPGLLEMERQISVSSPDQQDRPVTNFAINFENLKTSPLSVTFAISLAIRRILLAACRLVWAIWTYRALVNELDSLTEADFRDLGVRPKDAASLAWKEAWRRAAERYHPH
jgi:uncharacterized protein YjiS (DUF1127 family)